MGRVHKVLSSSSRTVGERDRKRREREGRRGGEEKRRKGQEQRGPHYNPKLSSICGSGVFLHGQSSHTLPLAHVPLVMSTHAALAGEPWGLHRPSTPDQHVKTSFQTLRGAAEGWAGTQTLSRESVGPSIHLHLKLSVISMFI